MAELPKDIQKFLKEFKVLTKKQVEVLREENKRGFLEYEKLLRLYISYIRKPEIKVVPKDDEEQVFEDISVTTPEIIALDEAQEEAEVIIRTAELEELSQDEQDLVTVQTEIDVAVYDMEEYIQEDTVQVFKVQKEHQQGAEFASLVELARDGGKIEFNEKDSSVVIYIVNLLQHIPTRKVKATKEVEIVKDKNFKEKYNR
jgi:hypothetical protein